MIRGAIDNVTPLGDGRVVVGGWAANDFSGAIRPVDTFSISGGNGLEVTRSERGDFKEAGQFGFTLMLSSVETFARFYYGAITVYAHVNDEVAQIEIWPQLESKILAIIGTHLVQKLEPDAAGDLLGAASKRARSVRETRTDLVYEPILFGIGATSLDQSVVIGGGGFLFLFSGSNSLHAQYSQENNSQLTAAWITLIRKRAQFCSASGVGFIQMIVPEKQSIIPEHYPLRIQTPTPTLDSINGQLGSHDYYIDCYQLLKNFYEFDGLVPYRKVDSHPSLFGMICLTREVVRILGIEANIVPSALEDTFLGGDLGNMLLCGEVVEASLVPISSEWPFAQRVPTLTDSYDPLEGHVGAMRQWECDSPLTDKHVLIFGNSVFERGGSPYGLSWWLSRIFKKTTFVWSAVLNHKLVDELQPNLVLAQTVERFLPGLPAT